MKLLRYGPKGQEKPGTLDAVAAHPGCGGAFFCCAAAL